MYMQNYKDILVYNVLRINLNGNLETYNIFNNTKTYMRACKAIDEYLKTKDRDKLKTDIDSAVKSEQYARFEYESIVTDLMSNQSLLALAKGYGISDNAYRKWLIKRGLPSKSKDIKVFLSRQ